jgi:hypothetical protein
MSRLLLAQRERGGGDENHGKSDERQLWSRY